MCNTAVSNKNCEELFFLRFMKSSAQRKLSSVTEKISAPVETHLLKVHARIRLTVILLGTGYTG